MNSRVITRVVGIDLSLTSTGIGIVVRSADGRCRIASSSVKTTLVKSGTRLVQGRGRKPADQIGAAKETLADRVTRQREITREVCHFATVADLVVIEGMIGGVRAGKPVDRDATWMRIVDRVVTAGIPIGVVTPQVIKKAMTDNGAADKAAVAGALVGLYPDLIINNSDEADAMGAAHLGAVLLGWDVKTLARHRDLKWTEHPGELDASLAPAERIAV